MLLEFTIQNYKSFIEETTFSMIAAPKQSGLDYSICEKTVGQEKFKVLCSSVIYGPNASGKTNIIAALDTLCSIVLRGNINNEETRKYPNPASSSLELIPNKKYITPEPVKFSIKFVMGGKLFFYSIELDLGVFLDEAYERQVLLETLEINNKTIFVRKQSRLEIIDIDEISKNISETVLNNPDGAENIAEDGLNPDELFLSNGFKVIYSQSIVKEIHNWFSQKLETICHADILEIENNFPGNKSNTVYVEKTLNEAAKIFGINSNALGYVVSENTSKAKLCSLFNDLNNENKAVPIDLFESYGTIRFVNLFPIIAKAIATGGILVIDEFDASLHPMALMSIINIFHNDNININHAQLIFNTHNPIFLNKNLFRRDEIKFVERDDEDHSSSLYSLSDFGTSGKDGVRKGDDYMKNYFVNRYGAIKDIDFTPVFEYLLSSED